MEQSILNFVSHVYQTLSWPGVVLLMTIESACIPLPSEIIMPLAGWMLAQAAGLGVGFVVLAGVCGGIGNVFGSLISYVVGDKGGVPFLRRWGKYILISNHDLDRANHWFNAHGDWITFIARFVPGVRTFISLFAGIARMHLGRFILYAFLGSFIWSAALAYGGYVLGQNWEQIRAAIRPFDYPILGVIIVLIIVFFWLRLRSRKAAKETNGSNAKSG
jgi:membrane protein DedA with SNARE-associated domain